MSEKKFLVQDIRSIQGSELLGIVRNLRQDGYRFVQACATAKEEGYELLYSFDKDHDLVNFRIHVNEGDELESITKEYWSAFIYENELNDLFGIKFLHNALDYGGNFYKVAEPTPWKKK